MNRGEIWQVSFDPAIGRETQKARPAVVISRDSAGILPLRIVVPVTGWQPEFARYPWMVRIDPSAQNGLTKPSVADAFQVKSVSVKRLVRILGVMPAEKVQEIVVAVGVMINHP